MTQTAGIAPPLIKNNGEDNEVCLAWYAMLGDETDDRVISPSALLMFSSNATTNKARLDWLACTPRNTQYHTGARWLMMCAFWGCQADAAAPEAEEEVDVQLPSESR